MRKINKFNGKKSKFMTTLANKILINVRNSRISGFLATLSFLIMELKTENIIEFRAKFWSLHILIL